jgi:hypothetical protein
MSRLNKFALLSSAVVVSVGPASARPGHSLNKAGQIMSRCVSKTRALRRFGCTMEVQILGISEALALKRTEKDRVVMDGTRRIAVRELAFTVSGPAGREKEALAFPRYYHEIIANGSSYYALDAYQRRYVLHPLPPKGVTAEKSGAGIFGDYTFGDIVLSGGRQYVSNAQTSGKFLGEEIIDAIGCDKIQTRSNNVVYWIGRQDGLIRRVETALTPLMRIIESYTNFEIGGVIPPEEFAIKPPEGAQQVDSF